MSIKKSSLEQKWYFRVAKAFLLLLPLLVAVAAYLKGYINISNISQKNILDILQKNSVYIVYAVVGLVLYYLILKVIWRGFLYIAFGGLENDTKKKGSQATPTNNPAQQLIAPFIILAVIFAMAFLYQAGYIKFPRINLNSDKSSHTYGAACTTSSGKTGLYGTNGNCYTCSQGTAVTNPTSNCSNGIAGVYCCTDGSNGDNGNDECIPTGCGKLWRCAGSYYIGNQQISVPGMCFPIHPRNVYSSWTGTCRQCP